VKIPLDYYRILGLPPQATAEQLQQAHRDLSLQLPRREFSEVVISSRKYLIDQAYQVLSDVDLRRDYDAKLLATAYPVPASLPLETKANGRLGTDADLGEATLRSLATEPAVGEETALTITIEPEHLGGALLILLDLGEYEQVLSLAQPYGPVAATPGLLVQPGQADLALVMALACLELGREQWQQRHYEIAASSLQKGHDLLVRQNQFPAVRAEIQSELYKLRPYRILELVASPLDQTRQRRQGLQLLKAMLEDRGGIEGQENDLSGLAIDDFLRFIQQLRDYLTTTEQQELFEQEARRPSPVAIYLTVYALLARGFAEHQPALIRRAKQLLMRLGTHQDVHLEQAVCAMLLGQTEEASHALELSQEYEPLAYIREHSRQSPDLLPGLCLYTERWLREELFPHFRDFRDQQATLKDYFADSHVQAYLESMVLGPEAERPSQGRIQDHRSQLPRATAAPELLPKTAAKLPTAATMVAAQSDLGAEPKDGRTHPKAPFNPGIFGHGRPSMASTDSQTEATPSSSSTDGGLSVAERVAQLSPNGQMIVPNSPQPSSGKNSRVAASRDSKAVASLAPGQAFPPSSRLQQQQRRRLPLPGSPRWGRLSLVTLAALGILGLLGFGAMRTAGVLAGPRISGRPLEISLAEPAIEIPMAPTADQQIGVKDIAKGVIEDWLAVKRSALGKDHQSDRLADILLQPLLTQWQRRATAAVQENWYWDYQHSVTVESVSPDDPTADQLQVTATVQEQARLFEYDVENTSASYNDNLTMRYDLVRQEGKWYIQNMGQLASGN
jgi:hypothetical protein